MDVDEICTCLIEPRNTISKEYDIDRAESDSILLNNIIDLSELFETIDECRKKNRRMRL